MSESMYERVLRQKDTEIERLTLLAHDAAQRQVDAVGDALAIQAGEIVRLRVALEETTALIENVFDAAEDETRVYYSEWRAVLKQAHEVLGGAK